MYWWDEILDSLLDLVILIAMKRRTGHGEVSESSDQCKGMHVSCTWYSEVSESSDLCISVKECTSVAHDTPRLVRAVICVKECTSVAHDTPRLVRAVICVKECTSVAHDTPRLARAVICVSVLIDLYSLLTTALLLVGIVMFMTMYSCNQYLTCACSLSSEATVTVYKALPKL